MNTNTAIKDKPRKNPLVLFIHKLGSPPWFYNFTGKFIYVTMLTCIALLCGSAQLSGTFGRFACFEDDSAAAADGDHHDSAHAH